MKTYMTSRRILILVCFAFLACTSGMAQLNSIHYVDLDSPGPASPYLSWDTAATNIHDAVDAASDGDTVLITNGTYAITNQISISKGITVRSVNGSEKTVVENVFEVTLATLINDYRVFYLDHSNVVVDGFEIRKGEAANSGGGVYIGTNGGTVKNCTIISNSAHYGGGIYCKPGGVVQNCIISYNSAGSARGGVSCDGGVIQNCTISDNSGYHLAGGVYVLGGGTVENCTISANFAEEGGGVYCYQSTVRNCIIKRNASTYGKGCGAYLGSVGILLNCTIVSNWTTSGSDGGGVYVSTNLSAKIQNTIIWGNLADNGANIYPTAGVDVTYSCIGDTVMPGTGNVTNDPMFVDAGSDFRLQQGSPCIDTGSNDGAPVFDLEFNTRPLDGNGDGTAGVDMGAYEYTTNRVSAPTDVSASDGAYTSKVRVTWTAVSGATAYEVWRHTENDYFSATRIAEQVTATTYDDESGSRGQVYYYWVKALTSEFSDPDTGYSGTMVTRDFDGDGKTDVAVYHEATGYWFIKLSSTFTLSSAKFGEPGYEPVPADYDGDGITDIAVYQEASGYWYILLSGSGAISSFQLGAFELGPVPGDYEGKGLTDPGVYHEPSGYWYIFNSSSASLSYTKWGETGYTAVPGDYDGDGKTDVAVYHEGSGYWYILLSTTYSMTYQKFGALGYTPVSGDFDGDGKTDMAVYHESTGYWYILYSSTYTLGYTKLGEPGYTPVSGDYDGDGKTDLAVYHEETGYWYILLSGSQSLTSGQFGGPGFTAP
ncbi:right-handed parallel beta-helix repeat-containing protein [Verrucomicrobiota bacterium]